MAAYYNEFEPRAAAWLRALIKQGLIADGDVDDRSVRDVRPDDLRGYSQCHFFAGIGGWSYALRLAGWSDDRPVWTGSCPCQPFSAAGARKGFADDRHLWPDWFRLIRECRPSIVFGEQVARAIGAGWLDAVADDLEREGYALGAAVLPACAVSAPHERERLWFVADAGSQRRDGRKDAAGRNDIERAPAGREESANRVEICSGDLPDARGAELWQQSGRRSGTHGAGAALIGEYGAAQLVAVTRCERLQERRGLLGRSTGPLAATAPPYEWPAEPDLPRVAHGISDRVVKLRGLGNAIVPQVAAEFILAFEAARADA